MLGSVASATVVIAVAIIGFLLFGGRLDWGRSGKTILGCFLIFGAPVVSAGLLSATGNGPSYVRSQTPQIEVPAPIPLKSEVYDPYAGAAVQRR